MIDKKYCEAQFIIGRHMGKARDMQTDEWMDGTSPL